MCPNFFCQIFSFHPIFDMGENHDFWHTCIALHAGHARAHMCVHCAHNTVHAKHAICRQNGENTVSRPCSSKTSSSVYTIIAKAGSIAAALHGQCQFLICFSGISLLPLTAWWGKAQFAQQMYECSTLFKGLGHMIYTILCHGPGFTLFVRHCWKFCSTMLQITKHFTDSFQSQFLHFCLHCLYFLRQVFSSVTSSLNTTISACGH